MWSFPGAYANRGSGTQQASSDVVRVFITDLKTPVKPKPEDPRGSSGLERKNNTIGRPDAAPRRLVTLWCCFDVVPVT